MFYEGGTFSLFYATRDGQTARIASFLAATLREMGHDAISYELGDMLPPHALWEDSTACFVIAPIRFGRHLPSVDAFLTRYKKEIAAQPLILVSVNLTARKPEKQTVASNPYLRRWIRRHGLRPFIATVFAGKLDYKLYKGWERLAIRFIMKITGGPTQPDTCIDFTPWDQVEGLAKRVAKLAPAQGVQEGRA